MRTLTFLLATAAALVALVASASGAGTTQISGIQSVFSPDPPVTSCPESTANPPVYEMAGSLVGCWYTDTITQFRDHPSGTIQIAGTEHFVGCLNGDAAKCGTLHTTFTFTTKFDTTTGAEIHGRCHHPIVSGDGFFEGATGVLDFKDDVTNGTAPYRGHISLQ
jgi:hypothetical protein